MISIIILIFLLTFSAFLSSAETALFSLSPFTLRSYKYDESNRKKLIARLLDRPRELLVTLMMLNILGNILIQNTVSNFFTNINSWLLKVGLPLLLTLFIGEIIPKSIAIGHNKSVSHFVAPFIAFIARILGFLRKIVVSITTFISRFMFFFLKREKPISSEELQHIIHSSKKTGVLNIDETELSSGYLKLKESNVKEIMRPKDEIIFFDMHRPLNDLVQIFSKDKCSRVPVCSGKLDKVEGIVSVREFFFNQDRIKDAKDLKDILSAAFFIPETTKALDLLEKLRENNKKIALVVDEYGSISGLISQEDLMETVIGEVEDLRDVNKNYVRSSSEVIIASGKLELSEFEDIFTIKLKCSSSVVTLGGYLIEKFEDIPQAGTKYFTDEFLFYILEADPKMIKKIYVRRLKENE